MAKKIYFSVIFVLVCSLTIALFCYRTYQYSPDYVIPDEFEEYDENEKEDDSFTEDDSSFSAKSLIFTFEQINSVGNSYLAEKINNAEVSEELEANSSDSEAEYTTIEVIEATTFYCNAENYLNIRDTPSADGEILGAVFRAEELEVYGLVTLNTGEVWAEITYNETIGFVCADYLSESPVSKYSQSDIYLFAQILYAEAGGCDRAEMARVGQVVLNRINTDYKEFKCCVDIRTALYHTGAYPDTVKKIENGLIPSEDALQVAEGLLNGTINSGISTNVLWQTGFVPDWEATVVYVSEWGHYYSVLAK